MKRSLMPFAPRTVALLVAAAFAGHGYANTGRVEFVFGGATLRNAQGERALSRGAELRTGDTVVTTDGRAQIRFSDGAFVSLQPNSEFKIDEYKFDGQTDGTERGIFGLAKGAMRTVTGLIGRVNKKSYEVRTPTATVGIRGTGGIISILLDGGTLVRGTHGIWTLTNLAGESIDIPAGRAGVAGPDKSQPPKQTSQGPSAPPAPPLPQTSEVRYSKVEDPLFPQTVLQDTGVPIGIVFADVFGSVDIAAILLADVPGFSLKGNIGPAGELTGFSFRELATGTGFQFAFAGTLHESGSDGIISWGRWTGPITLTSITNGVPQTVTVDGYGPNQGFHYAIGVPTAQMPTTGTFFYNMLGATAPTIQDGSIAPGTVSSASMVGQFLPTGGKVGVVVNYSFNGSSWFLQSPGGTCTPSLSITGNTFGGSATNQIVGGACGPCQTPCTGGQIVGGFAGVGATRAGVAYQVPIVPGGAQIGGVVAFKQSGAP